MASEDYIIVRHHPSCYNHMKLIFLFLLVSIFMPNAMAQPVVDNTKLFVLGVVDEIDSKILAEKRVINIYLPDNFNQHDSVHYPVIYLLDGGADEDFIHVAGLVQFNTFSWINLLPKTILVGIANTDRLGDFTFPTSIPADQKNYQGEGHSHEFISFIEKELLPFISDKYKASGESTLIGQSMGGLLATEILFSKPNLFNNYIIISPSLWWDNASILRTDPAILKADYTTRKKIYIGVGKEGLTPGENERVMEVDAKLLAEKIRSAKNDLLQVWFDYLPGDDHATIAHQAVFNAMRLLFADSK